MLQFPACGLVAQAMKGRTNMRAMRAEQFSGYKELKLVDLLRPAVTDGKAPMPINPIDGHIMSFAPALTHHQTADPISTGLKTTPSGSNRVWQPANFRMRRNASTEIAVKKSVL
jgi:hypothetical protein